jgi:hypothetical protein
MPEAVHRLKDILVEEVSLVDRAANKRRFLLVKREGDMSELRSDGRGGFTRVNKADDEEPEDETEKAKKKPAFPGAAKPFGAKAKGDDEEPEEEDAEKGKKKKPPFPGAKPFAAKPKDDDEEDPEEDPDDDDDEEKRKKAAEEEPEDEEKRAAAEKRAGAKLASQLTSLAGDLSKLAQKLDEDDEEPSDVHMKKIIAAHRKLGGMADRYLKRTAKKSIDVAKIGAKMSQGRLSMFKDALQSLQSLLSELMDSPSKDKDHAADPGDPQVAAPGFKAANPSNVPTNATGAAAVKAIAKSFDELLGVVKDQSAKIAKLEKGINPSNALAVDRIGKSAEVVWPMDMNQTPRDKIAKGDSFFDD